jgi:hypothetical protein
VTEIQRDDQVQDLRKAKRIGRVIHVGARFVRITWPSGRTTAVARHLITSSSRHYHVITQRPRALAGLATTLATYRDHKGRWTCCACSSTRVVLLRPWRVLLWTDGPWRGKSAVVCSDRCHSRLRSVANAPT